MTRKLHVQRLTLRLRGVPAAAARGWASQVAAAVHEGLAQAPTGAVPRHIGVVALGSTPAGRAPGVITERVRAAVGGSRLRGGEK